jgi:cysteine-rich repeat protein
MSKSNRHEQALTVLFIGVIAVLFVVQARVALQPDHRVSFQLDRMNLAYGYGSSAASSAGPLECGANSGASDALLWSNHCYLLYKTTDKNWPDAKTACATYSGSYLASLTTASENLAMSGLTITGNSWIGLNDQVSEGTFVWDHGETFSYSNWAVGEPNDSGGEDCVVLQTLLAWNDGTCNTTLTDYICEVETAAVCGNGTKEGVEACDDGDTSSGDGCSATCTVESGWSCVGTTPTVCSEVCGNGIKTSGEGCDDGNVSNGDGCSSSCTVQSGWSCSGTPSSCSTTCGDSIVAGAEQCDDGNGVNTDACRNTCVFASCGDGIVQPNGLDNISGNADDESCDTSGESASCDDNCTAVACGDQNINQAAGETCDDGNTANTDACLNSCVVASCGDAYIRNGVETCEPPGVGTCSTACQEVRGIGRSGADDDEPITSSSAASRRGPPPHCGNAVVEPEKGEKCDQGRFNGLSPLCDRWCNDTFCGDGTVHAEEEECEPIRQDDGSFSAQMCGGRMCTIPVCTASGECYGGCNWVFLPACRVTSTNEGQPIFEAPGRLDDDLTSVSTSSAPTAEPTSGGAVPVIPVFESTPISSIPSDIAVNPPLSLPIFSIGLPDSSSAMPVMTSSYCGNGMREGSEQCDDGARNSDILPDSCRTTCTVSICGDRVTDYGEECDDGNDILGDGCTPLCTRSSCGNNVLEPGEECDDGVLNSDSNPDSCSSRCLLPRCGDGVLDASFGEACDQGYDNSNSIPDRCRLNCVRPHCGDGIQDSTEQCDDGNASNFDSCSTSCFVMGCGNGVLEWNEACDDGNTTSADGCSASCTVETLTLLQWFNNAIRLPFGW